MNYIFHYILSKIALVVHWLILSSKDPQKTSLFVKGWLLMCVPYVIQALGFACAFGSVCVDFDRSQLEAVIEAIGQLVYFVTSAIATWAIVWGGLRKLWLTMTGKNQVLK